MFRCCFRILWGTSWKLLGLSWRQFGGVVGHLGVSLGSLREVFREFLGGSWATMRPRSPKTPLRAPRRPPGGPQRPPGRPPETPQTAYETRPELQPPRISVGEKVNKKSPSALIENHFLDISRGRQTAHTLFAVLRFRPGGMREAIE